MMEGTEDLPAAEANNSGKKKINKMKNKRRFSDEQVRLLETIFESETRLDPRKKQQVARDLGLQPQQVAIWFQNRRARWKSKQIEHQYRLLKADYDNLASQFEALKKEKQSLLIQLQNLSEFAGKHSNRSSPIKDLEGSKADGGSVNEKTKCDPELKPGFSRRGLDYDGFMCPRNDNTRDLELYREEGRDQLLNVGDQTNGSSTSAEKWRSFDSGGSFDQSCNSSLWFWTSGAEAYSLLP